MQEEAPGMVFWHNDGWTIFRELEVFVRSKLKEYQYQEVKGPFMMDRVLWEKTGHWDNYKDAMFTTSSENREYCIKPMNCPGHVQIFNQGLICRCVWPSLVAATVTSRQVRCMA